MPAYKKIIGANIKRERVSRGISSEELANMLNLSSPFIGLIERGQRGAKLENLIKISEIFGITVNDLIYENVEKAANQVSEPKHKCPVESKRSAIVSLIFDFNESELDFLIATIRNLKSFRKNSLSEDNYDYGDLESDSDSEEF